MQMILSYVKAQWQKQHNRFAMLTTGKGPNGLTPMLTAWIVNLLQDGELAKETLM